MKLLEKFKDKKVRYIVGFVLIVSVVAGGAYLYLDMQKPEAPEQPESQGKLINLTREEAEKEFNSLVVDEFDLDLDHDGSYDEERLAHLKSQYAKAEDKLNKFKQKILNSTLDDELQLHFLEKANNELRDLGNYQNLLKRFEKRIIEKAEAEDTLIVEAEFEDTSKVEAEFEDTSKVEAEVKPEPEPTKEPEKTPKPTKKPEKTPEPETPKEPEKTPEPIPRPAYGTVKEEVSNEEVDAHWPDWEFGYASHVWNGERWETTIFMSGFTSDSRREEYMQHAWPKLSPPERDGEPGEEIKSYAWVFLGK